MSYKLQKPYTDKQRADFIVLHNHQAVLAHSDIRTTMKYVHLQDNSIKEAISVLNSYN